MAIQESGEMYLENIWVLKKEIRTSSLNRYCKLCLL